MFALPRFAPQKRGRADDPIAWRVREWQRQGVPLLPPLTHAEIAGRSRLAGKPLSADVVRLYSLCGGMRDGEDDKSLFSLWPLERALHESLDYRDGLIPFADGIISSFTFCLKMEDVSETASVYIDYGGDTPPKRAAASLAEAFDLLLRDPLVLGLPPD